MIPKFRAYVKNGDNYLKCDSDRWVFVLYDISFGENVKVHDHMISLTTTKENVVQYTGLKDKHGVEIFEGDVVKRGSVPNPFLNNEIFSVIQARTGEWRIDNDRSGLVLGFCNDNLEIIGNIYENGDLLRRNNSQFG